MATFKYSAITSFPFTTAFTVTDIFSFDLDTISAASITSIVTTAGNTTFSLPGGNIVLTGFDIGLIDASKFIFADGSKLLIGDTKVGIDTGDNVLVSGLFDDYIDGVSGVDTASYASAVYAVTVSLATGNSTGGAGEDRLVNIDNLIGSNYNDSLTGDANANRLDGGLGVDTLVGGAGNDTYVVTAGDIVSEAANGGTTDLVIASVDWTLSAEVEQLTLTGAALVGIGNGGSNTITGNSSANIIDGGAGVDTMIGGDGNDTYIVETTNEIVTELATATSGAQDWVYSSATSHTLATNVENLRLTGINNIAATGNASANTMIGNKGNNSLDGSTGNDTITDLLGGNDTLIGGDGVDTLSSGKGNDILIATTGTGDSTDDLDLDTLIGGSGEDTYWVTAQTDTVIEADNLTFGTLTSTAYGLNDGDLINSYGTYALNDAAGLGVDNLYLVGTASVNATGNKINNVIRGNSGTNTLNGGLGNDTIDGATAAGGTDTLIGGDGADTITGGSGNDILIGNLAITDIIGDGDVDTMDGGTGNDTYYVSDVNDIVRDNGAALVAAQTLAVNAALDKVNTIVTYTISDSKIENLTLIGSAVINGFANASANIVTGNGASNVLVGSAGADSLIGGAGNDTLIGGTAVGIVADTAGDSAIDTMDGGSGDDTYYVTDATDVVSETGTLAGTNGTDTVISTQSFLLTDKIEHLTFVAGSSAVTGTGNAANNTIKGNEQNNILIGLAGVDILEGGAGDDRLVGGVDGAPTGQSSNDTLKGGDGEDTYVIDSVTGDLVVETNTITNGTQDDTVFLNVVTGTGTYTLTTNVENLVLGAHTGTVGTAITATSNNLNGTGNAFNNNIAGNAGKNTLIGGAGIDTLNGGDGDDILINNTAITGVADGAVDTLIGGNGNDSYYVNETTDVVRDQATALTAAQTTTATVGLDTVFATLAAAATYTISDSNIENLTLLGITASNGTGNASANILTGNSAINTLNGLDGNDILDGKAGADTMNGGLGDDTYVVDNATDKVVESANQGTDLVQASVTYTITDSDVENLTLIGTTAINGTGNSSANVLTGNTAANALSGGNGGDTLIGGAGKDTLTGGDNNTALATGFDKFVFLSSADSTLAAFDIITDFGFGDDPQDGVPSVFVSDVIDLSAIFSGTLLFNATAKTTAFTTATANTVEYYINGGNTFVIADTTGDAVIDFQVQLTGYTSGLTAADFVL